MVIPRKTILKLLLRGIDDLSFIYTIKKDAKTKKDGRYGIRTKGIVAYYEKDHASLILLTAYKVGQENESITSRAIAISGMLISFIKNDIQTTY